MKKKVTLCLMAAIMISGGTLNADKHTRNQLKSMESTKWGFTPKEYYYSWYEKKIDVGLFDISITVPGLGIHDNGPAGLGIGGDNYVNEKWRMMTPLRITSVAEGTLQANNTDAERDSWNDIMMKDIVTYTDGSTDLPLVGAYEVTQEDRDHYSQIILDVIYDIKDKYEETALEIQDEYVTIREEVTTIKNAYAPNASKLLLMNEANKKLAELAKNAQNTRTILLCMENTINWDKYFK